MRANRQAFNKENINSEIAASINILEWLQEITNGDCSNSPSFHRARYFGNNPSSSYFLPFVMGYPIIYGIRNRMDLEQ